MNVSNVAKCIIYIAIEICSLDYTKYNVCGSRGQQFIRPRMLFGLSEDLSLEDSVFPSSDCEARDLLLSKKPAS